MTSVSLVSLQTVGEYIDIFYNSQSYYDIGINCIELNSLSFGYMSARINARAQVHEPYKSATVYIAAPPAVCSLRLFFIQTTYRTCARSVFLRQR